VSRRQRIINLAIAAVIAIVAVVVLLATSGDDDAPEREATSTPAPTVSAQPTAKGDEAKPTPSPTPTPEPTPDIVVKDGEVVGGVEELEYDQGDRVRFSVTSDVADHVHVHAYDLMEDVAPGKPVDFDFKATITGITEIELEDAGLPIAELRVNP
jgi:hypothetical protein